LIRVRILVPVHNTLNNKMAKVSEYIKESYVELTEKVTWPTWRELQSSSILVLIAAFIIALVILFMDQSIHFLLTQFYTSLT
jgi:preprotein translocase subunit SecE